MNKYQEALNELCSRCYVESDRCTCHARYSGGKCNDNCSYRQALQELINEHEKLKEENQKLKDKETPKKPISKRLYYNCHNGECDKTFIHYCPVCHFYSVDKDYANYCPNCAQKLDWSVE